MDTLQFKTTIKCAACVAKVTPALNETVGEQQWTVDLSDPERTLTVTLEAGREVNIPEVLAKVGYAATEK